MAISTLGGGGSVTLTQPTVQALNITAAADTGGNTSGQYFLISSTGNDFYFWNNVSGASLDPRLPGKTGVQVVYNSGATAATIATAIVNAFQLISSVFLATVSTTNANVVQVSALSTGSPLNPSNVGTSTWTVTVVQAGTGFSGAGISQSDTFQIAPVTDVNSSTINKYFLVSNATTNYYLWNNVQTNQVVSVTTVADSGGSLNSKYFLISTTSIDYYVWFNVNSAGVNPAPANRSLLATIAMLTNTVANTVASDIVNGVNGIAGFTASAIGNVVTISYVNQAGAGLHPAADFNTGFTVTTTNLGGGVDPAVPNRIGVPVTYLQNALPSAITAAISTAASTAGYNGGLLNNNTVVQLSSQFSSPPLIAPSVGTSTFPLTRTKQGCTYQKSFGGGPFTVTLFTTPATANYTYTVEVLLSPTSIWLGTTGQPTAGIEWTFVGNNLKQVSTTTDQTFYPNAADTRVATGGWKTITCGPSTPVTVSGWAYSASETYSISYNYIGYLVS